MFVEERVRGTKKTADWIDVAVDGASSYDDCATGCAEEESVGIVERFVDDGAE